MNTYRVTCTPDNGIAPSTVTVESATPLRLGQIGTRAMLRAFAPGTLNGAGMSYAVEILTGDAADRSHPGITVLGA